MKNDIAIVADVFKEAGWEGIPLSDTMKQAGLGGIFVSSYAAVGVAISNSTNDVLANWAECQSQMSDLRENKAVGKNKDLYLLLIVSAIDESMLADLQTVVNDTYVCRKICIERKERALEEVLMDTPFLKVVGHDVEKEDQISSVAADLASHGMPHQLLEDLARRSSKKILEKLLAGKYKKGVQSNED